MDPDQAEYIDVPDSIHCLSGHVTADRGEEACAVLSGTGDIAHCDLGAVQGLISESIEIDCK